MAMVSKEIIIADLLRIDQGLIPVLMDCGMHCIGCPSALGETLEEAAYVHGLDPDEVVDALNNYLASR